MVLVNKNGVVLGLRIGIHELAIDVFSTMDVLDVQPILHLARRFRALLIKSWMGVKRIS